MAYKPPMIKREALQGQATVKVGNKDGKKVFGVTFEKNPQVTYTVNAKNAPDYVTAGEFYVKMSEDKTKILATSPQSGKFKVIVESFPAKEGEQPAPYTYVNPKYDNPTQRFNVLLKIVSEKYKGMPILLMLPYFWFDMDEQVVEGVSREVVGLRLPKKTSIGFKLLNSFLSASGAWKFGAIKWSDNVLPALQKRILRAATEFVVRVENGFVDTIEYDDEEPDEDFVEEKPTKKKPAKVAVVEDDDVVETESTDWGEPDEEDKPTKGSDEASWEEVEE